MYWRSYCQLLWKRYCYFSCCFIGHHKNKTKQQHGVLGEQSVSGKGWAQGSQLRMELFLSISFFVVIQSPAIPKQTGEDSLSLLEQQKWPTGHREGRRPLHLLCRYQSGNTQLCVVPPELFSIVIINNPHTTLGFRSTCGWFTSGKMITKTGFHSYWKHATFSNKLAINASQWKDLTPAPDSVNDSNQVQCDPWISVKQFPEGRDAMGMAHPYPHSQALLWKRWSGKQRSQLLGNRAWLACCLMFVNGKERKTNLCKKTQQTQMKSKYEAAQQISGYTSAQNSQTQTPDIPTVQFPDCVLLSYIHSWGLRQAFFSDFRRPWFPCGSPDKTMLPLPVRARSASGSCGEWWWGMGLSPTHLHGHSCMINAIFTQNVISRLKLETSHSQICYWPT